MRTARFEVYEAKDGWRWRLIAANNRQIAQGEAHTRERDAWRAAEMVKATAQLAKTPWLKWRASFGKYPDGSSFLTSEEVRSRF